MSRARQGTYSIVARDPGTRELGVAVQSHWFSVGSVVSWARPGVGAVATQANAEIAYGPKLLDLLEAGRSPQDALAALLAEDASAASRQVAVVDAAGRVAAHTGPDCIPFAGHVTGEAVSCQANIMASATVWPAMLEAYDAAEGNLTARLMAALEAAEGQGGDLRGKQSAAILVVPAEGERWSTVVSLRVEDHDAPLPELARLITLHDAYALAARADGLVGEGRHAEAGELYERASALAPENHELLFWAGLGAAEAGDLDAGVRRVQAAIAMHPPWRELLERLPEHVAPSAAPVADALSGRD
ncbi:MAG TPA: DUF1028 domain-containing protein [Solirubrobacteraceae bacterium]|nr:DUF1028 domain-containing protein [Solirubrobacteraceae bacterium]